jgi:hypothetical protein|tara:strand:+ start:3906 stop:4262 length:357 start_codon:yes stop_codon:yes gene_type:complete
MFKRNLVLLPLLVTAMAGAYGTLEKDYFGGVETQLKSGVSFGILVLVQALFGGRGLTEVPDRMNKILDNKFVKFIALFLITFSGTQDIEASVFIVMAFLVMMQLMRTKEERKTHPYLI